MSEIVKLCGAALLALAATLILKDSRAAHPELVAVIFALLVLSRLVTNVSGIVDFMRTLTSGTAAEAYVPTLLKASGIAYLADITADICRSSGEHGIASYAELAGKAEIVILALPLLSELVGLALGLLGV